MYYRFLPAWREALGERFQILFFDHLATDPQGTVKTLCEWLEIDFAAAETFDYSVENKTEQYRLGWLQRLALAGNRRLQPFFRRFHGVKKTLRRAYYRLNRDPRGNRPLAPECRARLEAIYTQPNRQLAQQLLAYGYDHFPPWLQASHSMVM
jgi:hypothetical protein